MRSVRDLLVDQELQRRAWRGVRRFGAYVAGGVLGTLIAELTSRLVEGQTAKLLVWAATLLVLLLLWGAGTWFRELSNPQGTYSATEQERIPR